MANPSPSTTHTFVNESKAPTRRSDDTSVNSGSDHQPTASAHSVETRAAFLSVSRLDIKPTLCRGPEKQTFPLILHQLLSDESTHCAIDWMEDGRSFGFERSPRFCAILRSKFRSDKVESFIRQLNMYQFRKTKPARSVRGTDQSMARHVYSHPRFNRDSTESQLRTLTKKTGASNKHHKVQPSHPPRNVTDKIQRLGNTQKELTLQYRAVIGIMKERLGTEFKLENDNEAELRESELPKTLLSAAGLQDGAMEQMIATIEEKQRFQRETISKLCTMLHVPENTIQAGTVIKADEAARA